MSRTRRIVGATVIGYIHQATIILVGLWLTPFLLNRIGQHDLGLWLVTGQLLGYLALMDLGVLAILPREVAFASGLGTDAHPRVAALVRQVRRIVRWQVLGLAVACLAMWLFLPRDWQGLRWPLAWVFAAFVICYPLRVPTAALQGLQDLPFLAKTQMAGWAAGTIATIAMVLTGAHLAALVAGWVLTQVLPAAFAFWRLQAHWQLPEPTAPAAHTRRYFKRSAWISISQIAQVLTNGSDVLLIGRLLGAAAVVPYTCTGKLVTVFANHPQLLMHAAQPALTELRASGSREHLTRVATALSQAMLIMSGALVAVIIPVNHFFVNWWVGPSQFGGLSLTVAFTAMMLLRHWNVAVNYTLFCFGYERQLSLTSLADGLACVVATPLLVWKLGPVGAPLASIIGAGAVSLPINLRSVAAEMGLSVGAFVRPFAPLLTRVLSVMTLAVVITVWLAETRLLPTVGLTAAVAGLYAAVVYPLVADGPLREYIDAMLAMVLRRKRTPATVPAENVA